MLALFFPLDNQDYFLSSSLERLAFICFSSTELINALNQYQLTLGSIYRPQFLQESPQEF